MAYGRVKRIREVKEGKRRFILFREGFFMRMQGEIDVGENFRLQDYLNSVRSERSERIPVSNVIWEAYNPEESVYKVTTETQRVLSENRKRKGQLRMDVIDLIYPLRHYSDPAKVREASMYFERVGIRFHLRGMSDHIRGYVLINKGIDESLDEKEERLAGHLNRRFFVAVNEPQNNDLFYRLQGIEDSELNDRLNRRELGPVLVNTKRIPYFEVYQ